MPILPPSFTICLDFLIADKSATDFAFLIGLTAHTNNFDNNPKLNICSVAK